MSGEDAVSASFWLLEAPDSLAEQSRRQPDGAGLGYFTDGGEPIVEKQPLAAYSDMEFARDVHEARSRVFVAHVRLATAGGVRQENTHPFEQGGRIFAHNGVIGDLDRLDAELGEHRALVGGDTDSERYFALITRRTAELGGDVRAGIVAAVTWLAQNVPVLSLNFVLIADDRLWALRYPDSYPFYVLHRGSGGPSGARHLDHASAARSIRVRSGDLAATDALVVASEPMDEDPGWRALDPGELVTVGPGTEFDSEVVVKERPAFPMSRNDVRRSGARVSKAPAE